MFHKFVRFVLPLVIYSGFVLCTTLALGQATGIKAVPDGGDMSATQAEVPGSVQAGFTIPLQSEGTASIDVALSEPGTSFRYVKTYGHTDDLYVVEQLRGMRSLKLPSTLPARFESHFPKAGLKEADWERQLQRKLYGAKTILFMKDVLQNLIEPGNGCC